MSAPFPRRASPRGSVLIWTVMLSMVLTSTFVFMAVRMGRSSLVLRGSLERRHAQAYLESYADYLEGLGSQGWEALETEGVGFDGISGSLSNQTEKLEGFMDSETELLLPLKSKVLVEWNRCQQGQAKESGTLSAEPKWEGPTASGKCAQVPGAQYNHWALVTPNEDGLLLQTGGEPLQYRITPAKTGQSLNGPQWQLKLELPLGKGKSIRLERAWR